MDSWLEDVRVFNDRSASHGDLLSVQIRMVNDGWLAVADFDAKTNSMAAITFL